MRTTLELPDSAVEQARSLSGITRISDLVREGLQALIAREARKRLISYGGTDPHATVVARQRWPDQVAENANPR